ncbi:MAG TPA: hypothetical protein VNK47_10205 [Candidatus Dormibacteraeota bacterium]|nr:hypothetical protein [Candidatus Dormibacteraeota bacterium]
MAGVSESIIEWVEQEISAANDFGLGASSRFGAKKRRGRFSLG